MKKWIVLILCIFIGISFAYDDARPASMTNNKTELAIAPITVDPVVLGVLEEMEDTASPVFEPFLGNEPIQLGITYYDMQHNASLGRNIAVDDEGAVHVCWMRSPNALLSSRQIYYSYVDADGNVLDMAGTTGLRCDFALYKSGYTTIDAYGCSPFIAYHEANSSTSDYHCQVSYDVVAMESDCLRHGGFGDCDPFPPLAYFPEEPSEPIVNIWPVVSVSQFDGDVHLISSSSSTDTTLPNYCVYYHGTLDGSEVLFEEDGLALHEMRGVTPSIATANDRDEIAVAFMHYMEDYTCTWPDGMNIYLMTSSDDGTTWDTTNITGNTGDFHDMPFDTIFYNVTWVAVDSVTGDTSYTPGVDTSVFYTRPSGGLSIFYDNEDYIHLTWSEGVYPNVDSCTGNTATSQPRSDIKHWTNRTGEIHSALSTDVVRGGRWPGGDATNPRYFFNCYSPNGSSDDDGNLYVIWQQYIGELFWVDLMAEEDSLDAVYYDFSAGAMANQEIFMSFSTDHGSTWRGPIDISNTYTPFCEAGECQSELDPTIARKINDKVHLFWIEDADAGTSIHDLGETVECPVKYVGIPLEDIEDAGEIVEGDGIKENFTIGTPKSFDLSSNYPNPFNVATEIAFNVKEAGNYSVEVYDVEGKLVRILANDFMAKGDHITAWNGTDMSGNTVTSGTYLYRIRDDKGNSIVRTMSLVK